MKTGNAANVDEVSVGSKEKSEASSPSKSKKAASATSKSQTKKKKTDKDKEKKKKEDSDDGSEHDKPFKDLFIEDIPPMRRNRLIFGNYEQDLKIGKALKKEATQVKDPSKTS